MGDLPAENENIQHEAESNFMNEEVIGDLQSKDEKVAALRKLYEFCASGELRRYKQEVAMQMEICKEILEKYENGTLF